MAAYVDVPDGGTCLDVGCGSGTLSIAVAKRNPDANVVGVDRWGTEYASFSQGLCERNAAAEGAANVAFQKGDGGRPVHGARRGVDAHAGRLVPARGQEVAAAGFDRLSSDAC